MRIHSLILSILLMAGLTFSTIGQEYHSDGMIQFKKLDKLKWEEVFYDSCSNDWKEQWTLDGKKATITHSNKGMDFKAGPNYRENGSHAVLWTKQSFTGDIRLEYEYTKLDDVIEAVTILYIQATGSGAEGYDKDISKWADKREVAAMNLYFNPWSTGCRKMEKLHLKL